jgi:Zn-dependent alcohol dehydrogenase
MIAGSMRAVVLRAAGGPEQLVYEQVATPVPRQGEALVRVHAAAASAFARSMAADKHGKVVLDVAR